MIPGYGFARCLNFPLPIPGAVDATIALGRTIVYEGAQLASNMRMRIFISSPDDVEPERSLAYAVVVQLQARFRGCLLSIEPIFGKHDAMPGTATFQEEIMLASKTDIVLCILWARMGLQLPKQYQRPDGTLPTETEWVFEDVIASFQTPDVPNFLVYRKTATPSVTAENQLAEWEKQKLALDGFLDQWFKNREDAFHAALNTFEDEEEFKRKLTAHLEEVINDVCARNWLWDKEMLWDKEISLGNTEKEKPLYLDENVQFTVYRPRMLQVERWYSLLVFAHLAAKRPDAPDEEPDPLEEVERQAHQVLGDDIRNYQERSQDSSQAVPREGVITFRPIIPGAIVNPPERSFAWLEPVHREDFRIGASARGTLRGRLTVYLGAIILAEVNLTIPVGTEDSDSAAPPKRQYALPYRQIFASYSHRDLAVVKQFENYAAALGDRYLRDAVHLRAGEMWSEQLQELIREAQVFQLFWSSNSMRSQFVRHEWEYALSLWRPNFVRPTYWEEPLPETPDKSLPSKELRRLHFQRISFPGPGSWRPADADERKKKLRPMHGARALCILAAAAFALGAILYWLWAILDWLLLR